MTMRIMSGVIAPVDLSRKGSATIIFNSHSLSGDVKNSGPDANRITVGPMRPYTSKPAFMVSIREFVLTEAADIRKRALGNLRDDWYETETYTMWTSVAIDHLKMGWEIKGDNPSGSIDGISWIPEFHYMIIGETE